jgi:hypothetical protein
VINTAQSLQEIGYFGVITASPILGFERQARILEKFADILFKLPIFNSIKD